MPFQSSFRARWKKSKLNKKIAETGHATYFIQTRLLFWSKFLKNSGVTWKELSCHERSRWLQNSSIILIGILVGKAAEFTLCSLLDQSDDAPSKDFVKPKLERLKRKSSDDNSPNNSFEKEENSNSFELELQREKNNPNSKSSSSSSSPSSSTSSSSKSSNNSSRKNSSNENITIKNGLQLQV